ncbi:MAG: hypothetical protein HQK83_01060 [Fibrobacteria bacterium]|nr:hypothetical protein [Fibrobacteria bacterium]
MYSYLLCFVILLFGCASVQDVQNRFAITSDKKKTRIYVRLFDLPKGYKLKMLFTKKYSAVPNYHVPNEDFSEKSEVVKLSTGNTNPFELIMEIQPGSWKISELEFMDSEWDFESNKYYSWVFDTKILVHFVAEENMLNYIGDFHFTGIADLPQKKSRTPASFFGFNAAKHDSVLFDGNLAKNKKYPWEIQVRNGVNADFIHNQFPQISTDIVWVNIANINNLKEVSGRNMVYTFFNAIPNQDPVGP